MEEENILEEWVTYGMSIKLPYGAIPELKNFIKKKGWHIIFDKPTLGYLRIVTSPSGNVDGENEKGN